MSLQWTNEKGMIKRTRGITRDLSQRGVYCHVEDPIPVNQDLEFDVFIPVEMTAGNAMALHCRARIVRTDSHDRRFGVAASIDSRKPVSLEGDSLDPQRRLRPRVRPARPTPVEFPTATSEIRDLSPTGAFIADERPFPLGRKLDLRFRLDGNGPAISVQAVVRRVDPQIGMAVEFTELSHETYHLLTEYAANNQHPN
jgi:PilZ domain-containing protein